jgi:hypothetical protein
VLIVLSLYSLLRLKRDDLVDFVVPRTAAARFLAGEPLYRPEDGHYQYKYFPTFALVMVPFTWVPKEVAEFAWFTLTVAMTWLFLRLSVSALPDRQRSARALFWLTLLLNGKFLVKELAFGQFNLPTGLCLLGAVIAAQHGRSLAPGAAIAAGVFVKPYALVLVPWLAWTRGWRPLVVFTALLAAGLMLPALYYGWSGNLTLLSEWYRTVSDTTGPNLMAFENVSFASMWAKWLTPGPAASRFALASAVCAAAAAAAIMLRRRRVAEPNYLEAAFFCLLVPLLSPQGWDYVLLIAMPAYTLLVDRFRVLPTTWRGVAVLGIFLTSFSIFDLLGRALYTEVMRLGGVTVGAVLIGACLIRLRWQAAA